MRIGGMVTVMSPDGKPIQVAANAAQMLGTQNSLGRTQLTKMLELLRLPRIVNKSWQW